MSKPETATKPKSKYAATRYLSKKQVELAPVDSSKLPEAPGKFKPKRNRSFKEHLLPAHLQGFEFRDTAVKAYIKELLLQFKTEPEIATIVTHITGEKRVKAQMLIQAAKLEQEVEFSKQSKDAILGFLQAAIFQGLKVCYETKDMSAYMRGCSLLKDIYGVEKKVRATFEPANPYEVFGSTFITLKSKHQPTPAESEEDNDSGE